MADLTWADRKPFSIRAAGIQYGGIQLGKGRPVLLLHGFPEHHASWRHVVPFLANNGRRAIALDLKGYKSTDAPRPGTPSGDYRLSTIARELGEVVRMISDTGSIDLIGHDWGGAILSAMLIVCPERIDRAVWVNGPGRLMVPWRLHHVFKFNIPGVAERQFWRRPVYFVEQIINTWSYRPEAFHADDILSYARAFQHGPAFKCAMAYYRGLRKDLKFLGPNLLRGARWRGESAVIWGQHDPIFPPIVGNALAREIGANLVPVDDAGHFPQTESPGPVNEAISSLLCG